MLLNVGVALSSKYCLLPLDGWIGFVRHSINMCLAGSFPRSVSTNRQGLSVNLSVAWKD
jgi:hypothetical protein